MHIPDFRVANIDKLHAWPDKHSIGAAQTINLIREIEGERGAK
jgi:hypothetical protein